MVEFDSPPDDMSKEDKTLDASTLSGYCLCSHQDKCVTSITQGTIAKRVTLDASMMKSNEKTFYFTYGWTPYYTSSKVKYYLKRKYNSPSSSKIHYCLGVILEQWSQQTLHCLCTSS